MQRCCFTVDQDWQGQVSGCFSIEIPMEKAIPLDPMARGPNRVARTPCVVSEPRKMRGEAKHPLSHVLVVGKTPALLERMDRMDLNKLVMLGRRSPT